MVVICSAPGCSAKKENITAKSPVQFHRFPLRKPDVLAKWVKAMKNPNFKPTVTSYLCSAHFAASDYDLKSTTAGKHLKPNAVPTYFEKKRPGRKKKFISENEGLEEVKGSKEHCMESKEPEESLEEEYLEDGAYEKVESNLAEIIGNQEKGTLHVLIVGEDGKITNSEYIFKKDIFFDDDSKPGLGISSNEGNRDEGSDDENGNVSKDNNDEKGSQTDVVPEILTFSYKDMKNKEKIKRLENSLSLSWKKAKVLEMKCRRMSRRMNELEVLLKLLVVKRGKGEKNLTQLVEEYEKFGADEVKVEVKGEEANF